ncbi:E3 ubiquitin-protein ligase HERC2 [Liparis tanakae]|uniref:E3 ubiquitin-protein ligase HERC2 n=1 Tax=Liparis tanakae TaxID=230148 RepID=A0A4Z2GCB3_9TELE|nr:E3 ubiquitin-protein ligase HERC2 [Liparis tanakae]
MRTSRVCLLGHLKPVPAPAFSVQSLPFSDAMLLVWAQLVSLAGSRMEKQRMKKSVSRGLAGRGRGHGGGGACDQVFIALFPPEADQVDVHLLRCQQLRLYMLKAGRALLAHQDQLRQILSQAAVFVEAGPPAEEPAASSPDGGDLSPEGPAPPLILLQQLLAAATQPSPVKAAFDRQEMEAASLAVCQYLAVESSSPSSPLCEDSVSSEASTPLAVQQVRPPRPRRQKPAPLPPPLPLVLQLMDMGFARKNVEFALKSLTGSTGGAAVPGAVVTESQTFKKRSDFQSNDDYAVYVRENIQVYDGYVGKVIKLDRDGLHDLNVQCDWQQKGGTYWVRYIHIELLELCFWCEMASSETPSLGHGVRIESDPGTPVEEVLLAVGDVVGHENVSDASRMNRGQSADLGGENMNEENTTRIQQERGNRWRNY